MIDLYFKMLFSLAFVLGIIGGIYYLLKKKNYEQNKKSLFEIIEYKPLSTKTGIMAIKFSKKVFLIAITPTNINPLYNMDWEDDDLMDENTSVEEIRKKIKVLKESLNELN